jgi:ABC-type sugar transport system ATPase subunit
MQTQTQNKLLEMKGVTKKFTGTVAVNLVDFDCIAGEVHCLVGENGAGKSTLMKILAGIHQPDSGTISINGQEIHLSNYSEARKHGIGVVYQELSLIPDCTVAENLFMGIWPRKKSGLIDWHQLYEKTSSILSSIHLHLDPKELISGLPVAVRQMVEIGKVLSQSPSLIIFDEPTASLSKDEVQLLFDIIRNLRSQGKGIIYISHRLAEIFELADRVTVMKDGKVMATKPLEEFTEESLISLMVGRELKEIFPSKSKISTNAKIVFSASVQYTPTSPLVSISVRQGEVLGIGGLQGQGQIRLLQTIFGIGQAYKLLIEINGVPYRIHNQYDAIAKNIALIPENRTEEGVFLTMSVSDNLSVVTLDRCSKIGFINRKQEIAAVSKMIKELSIITTSVHQIASSLSGGNIQKLVLGKWLLANPLVLILLEPTKGVDVGTKQHIYQLIRKLADQGIACILYTSDMLELIGMSNKVVVMNHNFISAELTGNSITEENIMRAAVAVADQGE